MTELQIEPLHADFAARVTGAALDGEIPEDALEELRAALNAYSMLCFPGQVMTVEK